MPVVRVPVVHKFGIVSVSRAEQLLRDGQRAGKRSAPKSSSALTKISQSFIEKYNNVSSDVEREKLDRIIQRVFSQAKYKAGLYRSQGTSGSDSRRGGEILAQSLETEEKEGRVCDAWLELILLCQCYGPHQEDVLLALAVSLNHAPISDIHIPSLLYMCGLCYQWLKSDLSLGSDSGHLRTGELMLLRIVYLISLRLYCHHVTGTLQDVCTREDIRQLKFDLEGFESRERVYRNFPEPLLHWKVSLEVGQTVVEGNCPSVLHDLQHDPSPGETATNSGSGSVKAGKGITRQERQRGRFREMSSLLKNSLEVWRAVRGQGKLESAISRLSVCPSGFNIDNWLESVLAIDVLSQASQLSLPVLHLLQSLATPSPTASSSPSLAFLTHNPWHKSTDTAPHSTPPRLSLSQINDSQISRDYSSTSRNSPPSSSAKKGTRFILPQAEKFNSGSMDGSISPHFPSLYRHHQVDTLNIAGQQPPFHEPYVESVYSEGGQNLEEEYPDRAIVEIDEREMRLFEAGGNKSAPVLRVTTLSNSDISQPVIKEPESDLLPLQSIVSDKEEEGGEGSACGTPITDKLDDLLSTLGESFVGDPRGGEPQSRRSVILLHRNLETRCTHYTHSSSALSGGAGVPGSHVTPSTVYRQSLYSPLTIDDMVEDEEDREPKDAYGGREDPIKSTDRVSKMWFESWPSEVRLALTLRMGEVVIYGRNSQIQSAALDGVVVGNEGERLVGLRQLMEYSSTSHSSPCKEKECMNWMIRHCAVLGLSRICRTNKQLVTKDGLAGSAWSLLMKDHSSETDNRVLEAYKVSQVCPDIDGPLLAMETAPLSSPLLTSIADHLARVFLPPPQIINFSALTTTTKSPPKRIAKPTRKTPPQVSAKVDTCHKKSNTTDSKQQQREGGLAGRTLRALNDIAEKDWRREMQKDREQEQRSVNL